MKVAVLTREYPPEVYGGAGVHVEHLAAQLALVEGVDVGVHCFGAPRADPLVAGAHEPWSVLADAPGAGTLGVLSADLAMAGALGDTDVVHSHTWYANFGGHLAKLLYGKPHVVTTHSLEPLRPWKAEQLGGGYEVSSFCERTAIEAADAVVAVSRAMGDDVQRVYPAVDPSRIHVIHNGIDAETYRPDLGTEWLDRYGVDPDRPTVVFVGRITRQKGIVHLLDAAALLDPSSQLVLCAGAPDTPEIGAEVRARVEALQAARPHVLWLDGMVPRAAVIQLVSHADVFVCPSIYEPFGLINLEAMACETAVVASAVGGIPEIVVDGETGSLVDFEPGRDAIGSPADPGGFAAALAQRIDQLLADPATARRWGQAGRARVLEHFTWPAIARRTAELYRSLD